MSDKPDWLSRQHALRPRLQEHADFLRELSHAFHMTGNHEVAIQLRYTANEISDIAEETGAIASAKINEDYAAMQNANANMLGACLAMAEKYK